MERWRILHKESNFTVIDNGIFQDKDLTLAEVGFLCKILSLPEEWQFNIEGIVSTISEGKKHVYAIINRLIEHGYCKREQSKDAKTGRYKCYDYTFYEVKNGLGCASAPHPALRHTVSRDTDSRHTAEDTQLNTNSNKILKEESKKGKGSTFVPPTLDQVKEAFVSCNFSSDPMEFWSHYTNCDWRLSGGRGAKMKDWKLAAYNWERREKQFNRNGR